MLKQTDKDKLKALGLDIDAIITAHTDAEEKDITVPEGQFITNEQLLTRDDVKMKEGEKTGEKKAIDIVKKELLAHAGIELKGDRWGKIGDELKGFVNGTGEEKIKQYQDQNKLLIKDKMELTAKVTAAETSLQTGMFEIGILGKLPAHAAGLTPKESLELAKMRGYMPEKTDTGIVWKKNGEPIKDPVTHAPLSEDKAIAQIWATEKWAATPQTPPAGGRGAGQKVIVDPSGGIKNKTQAEAAWKEMHPDRNMQTPEGMAWYTEQAKQPDFNMFE